MNIPGDIRINTQPNAQKGLEVTVMSMDNQILGMVEVVNGQIVVANMHPKIEDLPRDTVLSLVARLSGMPQILTNKQQAYLQLISTGEGTEVTLSVQHPNLSLREPFVRMVFDASGKVTEIKKDFAHVK